MSKNSTVTIVSTSAEREVLLKKILSARAKHVVRAYLDKRIPHLDRDAKLWLSQDIKIRSEKKSSGISLPRLFKDIIIISLMSAIAIVSGGLIGSFTGLFLLGNFAPAVGTVIGGTSGAVMALMIVYDHTILNRKQSKAALKQQAKREEDAQRAFEMVLSPALGSAQVEPHKIISHLLFEKNEPVSNTRFYEHAKALVILELANFDMNELQFMKTRIENLDKKDKKRTSNKGDEANIKKLDVRYLLEIDTSLSNAQIEKASAHNSESTETILTQTFTH